MHPKVRRSAPFLEGYKTRVAQIQTTSFWVSFFLDSRRWVAVVTLLGQGRGVFGGGVDCAGDRSPVAGTLEEINASDRVGDLDGRRSTSTR